MKEIEPIPSELSPDLKWYIEACEEAEKKFQEEMERLFYAAQEGSLLDKIWKGEKLTP